MNVNLQEIINKLQTAKGELQSSNASRSLLQD